MKQFVIISITLTILIGTAKAQQTNQRTLFNLAKKSQGWTEGFRKNIGSNEFSYHSFRNDVLKSLITRCTNGEMAIEWETASIPQNLENNKIGFLWIAAMDITNEKTFFDVYINGNKRFEIPAGNKQNWSLKTDDGGELSFATVETDQNDDAFGYMSLIAPANWLKKGEPQKIKITGRANSSNAWIIVYQADDALQFLQNSNTYNIWAELLIEISDKQLNATINTPAFLAGKKLAYIAGRKKGEVTLFKNKDMATGTFSLPKNVLNTPFTMRDEINEIFSVDKLAQNYESTKLLAKGILSVKSQITNNKIYLYASRNYNPKTIESLLELSNSKLAYGEIFLMNSSHQDIAWMDSPEKCIVERDTMLLTPLFEMAQKDKNYRFDIEDALMIKEFIERHPDKKELVKQMLNNGQISCGSAYTQPYEEMYSGEALARQFYFGAKWLKDEFGYNANVYWNEDVPGKTLQMMQLMQKAGTKYMMISRHERGLYKWYSPDGSYVTVYTPGHYAEAFSSLQKKFADAAQYLASSSLEWEKYYSEKNQSPVIPLLSDWDMSPAKDYSTLIQKWENIKELQNENKEQSAAKLPKFKIASASEFFDALTKENPKLTKIQGERPDVWLYIHGPSHQKALKASREGDILLTQAEKFATANAIVDASFINYPSKKLQNAWEAKIYPDHGWGGKNGDITDALFHQKFDFAKTEAEQILNESLKELSAKIKTQVNKGRPLIVFNSLNWERTDPASIEISFEKQDAFSILLKDERNHTVETQLEEVKYYPDGSIKEAELIINAEDIPSIGYKTYYLTTSKEKPEKKKGQFNKEVENQFYKLKFANGGLSSIFDKELGKELLNTGKFTAGEVFTMHSEGNGAGEFSDIQQPDMKGFDKTGNYNTVWEIEKDGSIFTTYKYRQKIRNAVVEQRIKLYHKEKRIDFETALLNWEGELYREFRMALPLNMQNGQVAYEVPFGVTEVGNDELKGAAGERYLTPCNEIHPRAIENWISCSNNDFGVTMSSSVVAVDWIDPTENPSNNQILQPILLASRKSCHWEGNEYLQTGNHYFSFSITSHTPGWENGAKFGRQANEKLLSVWVNNSYLDAHLPEKLSFFNINQDNVLISTIKKAEDSNDIILRITNLEDKDKIIDISSFSNIEKGWLASLIEENKKAINIRNNKLEYELGHNSIETFKLTLHKDE